MASEQFSLCWDNFHKNMSSGMNALLESEDLVDVTLAVEGKYLKAHKMVLSVCSPYFRELFRVNPCKHPIVFMKDVSYVAMTDLLQFMYQGEVQVSQDNLTTFIKTAEALQIKGLTGDGNGSADCDTEPEEPKMPEIEPPKPVRAAKKSHPSPIIPAKRPRHSHTDTPTTTPSSSTSAVSAAKTEPASVVATSTPSVESVNFKMEPYDHGGQSMTPSGLGGGVLEEGGDETFGDDPLEEGTGEDGGEDYSMMEGGEDEPQAGTSADGTAGEGQDFGVSAPPLKKYGRSAVSFEGFTYHQNTVKKIAHCDMRYLLCAEYKRLSCKARAQIPIGANLDDLVVRGEHNHPPYHHYKVKDEFMNALKEYVNCQPSTPLRQIYDNAAILNPEGAECCPYKNIATSMRRWRNNSL